MNANTRLRLWKEARALLPFWVAMAALMVLPFLLRSHTPLHFSLCAYYFGCALLGSVIFGQEFQHRTMGVLLSQPVSRRRLWWEKMSVLAAALLGLLLWLVVLGLIAVNDGSDLSSLDHGARINRSHELRLVHSYFLRWPEGLVGFAILLLPLFLGFCTGPLFTLLTRGTMGGVTLTFLCPFALHLIVYSPLSVESDEAPDVAILTLYFVTAFGLYPGALFLLGCRRFQRWEDCHGHGQELALPVALAKPFAGLTGRLTLGHGSAFGHLVRKEVRLHLPAFVVAGMLVVLWLLLLVVAFARPNVSQAFLMLPSVLLCLGIPVVAGIVSTAEERSLGVHEWHLTLPVSVLRQWFVKVLVALGVNVVLGILLPGVLGHGASWLLGEGRLMGLNLRDSGAFLIGNAVILGAALYASTASASSMRALIGTIVLFVAGAMVMNLAIKIVEWVPDTLNPMPDRHGWWPAPELFQWAFGIFAQLGWGFVVWFGVLCLANFRRTLESGWQPVRQLAPFFTAIGAFLVCVFVYHQMFSHYHWNYYEMNSSLRWDAQKRAKQRAVANGEVETSPPKPVPQRKANPTKPRD